MGTDDLFKKRRAERQQRKHDFKTPRANSYLIVTEGKCTEPLYFKGIKAKIEEKIGGSIEVVQAPQIDISGKGLGTGKLLEITDKIVKDSKINYQNVWIVFDKDDFEDFDEVIKEAKRKGYKVAWSNQSFEYWLFMHFEYSDSALHRDDWTKKLDDKFKELNLGSGKYCKNDANIYDLVNTYDGVNAAINHAKRRMADFDADKHRPSKYDPGTTVHELVQELKQYLEE